MCSSPACSLARLGRASLTSSSRRLSRPRVPAARLRRCEPPPSQCASRPLCYRRRLQLFSRQPFPRSLPTVSCSRAAERLVALVSSMKFVRRGRAQARSFINEIAGPVLRHLGAGCASQSPRELAALGRRRFAPPRRAPVASNSAPVGVLPGSSVTPTRSRCPYGARCWTQRRPPAGPSQRCRLVPSGQTCWVAYWSMVRVPPVARRGGHGYAIDRGRVLLAVVSLWASRECTRSAKWRPSMAWADC